MKSEAKHQGRYSVRITLCLCLLGTGCDFDLDSKGPDPSLRETHPAPYNLRLLPTGEKNYEAELRWDTRPAEQDLAAFRVYLSDQPASSHTPTPRDQLGLVYPEDRAFRVQIRPETGIWYMLVQAVYIDQIESSSEALVLDSKQKLLFHSSKEENGQASSRGSLWLGLPGEGKPRQEVPDVSAYAWSPRGNSMAYTVGEERLLVAGRIELSQGDPGYRMQQALPATSSGPGRDPSLPKDVEDLAWSPSGGRLAYLSQDRLFVWNLTHPPLQIGGEEKVRLLAPAWAPDENALAFLAETEGQVGGKELMLSLVVDSSDLRWSKPASVVRLGAGQEILCFQWSPRENRILYLLRREQTPGNPDSHLLGLVEASPENSLPAVPRILGEGRIAAYAWSPRGSRVAFLSNISDPAGQELFVNLSSGGSYTQMTRVGKDGEQIEEFIWSADGSWLYCVAHSETKQSSRVLRVFADGGEPEELYLAASGGSVFDLQASPQGKFLSCLLDPRTTLGNVLAVQPNTGGQFRGPGDVVPPNAGGGGNMPQATSTGRCQLLLIDLGATPPTTKILMPLLGAVEARWSPDGRELALRAYALAPIETEIFILRLHDPVFSVKFMGHDVGNNGPVRSMQWSPMAWRAPGTR